MRPARRSASPTVNRSRKSWNAPVPATTVSAASSTKWCRANCSETSKLFPVHPRTARETDSRSEAPHPFYEKWHSIHLSQENGELPPQTTGRPVRRRRLGSGTRDRRRQLGSSLAGASFGQASAGFFLN